MLVFIFGFVGATIGGIFMDKFKRFKALRIAQNFYFQDPGPAAGLVPSRGNLIVSYRANIWPL